LCSHLQSLKFSFPRKSLEQARVSDPRASLHRENAHPAQGLHIYKIKKNIRPNKKLSKSPLKNQKYESNLQFIALDTYWS